MNIIPRIFNILAAVIVLSSPCFGQEAKDYELVKINFQGNKKISDSELRTVILSKESPNWFSKFLNSFTGFGESAVYFDSLLIQNDLNALNNYYFDAGYFKAKFSYGYELNKKNAAAELTYIISEGEPSYFSSIRVSGLENIHKEFQSYILNASKVDTALQYSKAVVEKINNQIINYLRDHGHMLVATDVPLVKIDTLHNKAHLTIDLNAGKRYQIREVKVNKSGPGKDLVDDNLLREIVNVDSGKYYNFFNLQRGQTRLYRTNLFSSALVSGITADTSGNLVPINISVDVGLVNEFSPEIIFNNEDNRFNLGLSFGYIRKNFFGSARKLTVRTSAASQNILDFLGNPGLDDTTVIGYADARVIIEQPFIFGKPIYTKLENYITLQKRKNEYNATLFGSKLSFDFELPQNVYFTGLSSYLNWERSKYFLQESYIKNIFYKFFTNEGIPPDLSDSLSAYFSQEYEKRPQYTNATLGIELSSNKTNNFLFPSTGYSLSILLADGNGIAYAVNKSLGMNIEGPLYYKVLAASTFYLPVYFSNENAFGIKFLLGNIHSYKGNKFDIPLNQRFVSGGSNSVRGWQSRELEPSGSDVSVESLSPQDLEQILLREGSFGGFFIVEGSIETRNRLIGKIGSALFVDYGNTFLNPESFRFDKLAVAAGFGLRYYSEIVPIRIDFGFKFYDPTDRRSFFTKLGDSNFLGKHFSFHLGIGEAF